MSRRQFLSLLTTTATSQLVSRRALAGAPPPSTPRAKIRAICFDLFTIFDPRSVALVADSIVSGRGNDLWRAWKTRQFEYCWLRAAAGHYVDFEVVTDESLRFAADERKVSLSVADRRRLVDAYSELDPWPDTRDALATWKRAGLKLAPLANYSPEMLTRLLERSGLTHAFDAQISTDAARTFKPDPRAYALGPATLGLPKTQIAFAAFGGWDAAGAKWFGFPTVWLNRLGVTTEQLIAPDAIGADLSRLAAFVSSR